MELGEKLKQARLEAGLSQRQLCGDTITRNMLSQIENGSAKPSMDTLQTLAKRLEKPVSFFLEEEAVLLPNQTIMEKARQAEPAAALELLKDYQDPDPVYDPERYLLEALCCLRLARQVSQEKPGYAQSLLERAMKAGHKTPYYTQELERTRLLLCYAAGMPAAALAEDLPDLAAELQLRAEAALKQGDARRCALLLDAAGEGNAKWHYLRGEAYFAMQSYEQAAEHYRNAGEENRVFARLEICYRELGDYKMAYYYACRQR